MTPYYDDGQVTLYHGDCLEILPTLPRPMAHTVITDPPFELHPDSLRIMEDRNHKKYDPDSRLWLCPGSDSTTHSTRTPKS